jgi:valyl-tRNA synthetase
MDWMDAYGSDALRFTLARGANPGTDVPIGEEWVQGSRNFCNKLWNATRFALMNGAHLGELPPAATELSVPDRWILGRLHTTLAEVDALYEDFQFAKLADTLYHFAWDEFCDWYVELAKTPLAEGGAAAERTRLVLGHILDVLLRVLHPIMPFVTEKLWTTLTGQESVVITSWPVVDTSFYDAAAEAAMADLQALATEIRRFRSDQGLKPGQRVAARLAGDLGAIAVHEPEIRALTRLNQPETSFDPTSRLVVGDVTVELDLHGAVDFAAERQRLSKDLAAVRKVVEQADRKLANEQFLAKAPEAEVAKTREKRSAAHADIERLEAQLAALPPS